MAWEIEYTDEFEGWWNGLTDAEQRSVAVSVDLLAEFGPALSRPFADTLKGSQFPNMKELRVQHEGRPYRILFAFDPKRVGLLLIGGDKTGNARWYDEVIPEADKMFAAHLESLKKE